MTVGSYSLSWQVDERFQMGSHFLLIWNISPWPVADVACNIIPLTNDKGLNKLLHGGLPGKSFEFCQKAFCRTSISFVTSFHQVQILSIHSHSISNTSPIFPALIAWDIKLELNKEEHRFTCVITQKFHLRDKAIWRPQKRKTFRWIIL